FLYRFASCVFGGIDRREREQGKRRRYSHRPVSGELRSMSRPLSISKTLGQPHHCHSALLHKLEKNATSASLPAITSRIPCSHGKSIPPFVRNGNRSGEYKS